MPCSGMTLLLAVSLAALLSAAPALAASNRVPAGFYGVNFQRIAKLGPAAQNVQLASIASLGIDQVRFNASWAAIEPVAPKNGVHSYRWGPIDQQIAAMANHGIRAQPTLTQTPNWDAVQGGWVDLQCAKSSSRSPVSVDPYARFVRAFASRYGRGGRFWAANPGLPYTPVQRYEIWNEPNLKGGWCPRPQPWLYADMFVSAATAIKTVDPAATVYTAGVAPPSAKNTKNHKQYLGVAEFFGRATARQPKLNSFLDGAAVHVYPSTDGAKQLEKLAWFRSQLHDGRIANRIPMVVNEIGWATHVGKVPITEDERAAAYGKMTINYARTNCNVGGILPHTWISAQQSKTNPEDWYGIANPSTGAPYASANRYSFGLKLMEGRLPLEPPMKTLMACSACPSPTRTTTGSRTRTTTTRSTRAATETPAAPGERRVPGQPTPRARQASTSSRRLRKGPSKPFPWLEADPAAIRAQSEPGVQRPVSAFSASPSLCPFSGVHSASRAAASSAGIGFAESAITSAALRRRISERSNPSRPDSRSVSSIFSGASSPSPGPERGKQLLVGDLDALGVRNGCEDSLSLQRLLGLALHVGDELLPRLSLHLHVHRGVDPASA